MHIERRQDKALFLALWVLAGVVSYSVGFPVGRMLGGSLAWGWIIGGALISVSQYLLIRGQIDRPMWWIIGSAVGLCIGTGVSLLISQVIIQTAGLTVAFILVGASVGLGIGLGQWMVLRRQFGLTVSWAPISTVGYAMGLMAAVNTPLSLPAGPSLAFGPEFGGTLGAVVGVITGPLLLWLIQRPTAQLARAG